MSLRDYMEAIPEELEIDAIPWESIISVVGVRRGVSILAEPAVPVDPRTLSLTHFQSIAAARAARDAAPPAPDRVRMKQEADAPGADPLVIPAQFSPPPPRRMLMPGGGARPRTPQDEMLLLRFDSARRTLRELQPDNRELSFVWDPTRVPSEAWVRQWEREVEVARAGGGGGRLPAVPAERHEDGPRPFPLFTVEICATGHSRGGSAPWCGTRHSNSDSGGVCATSERTAEWGPAGEQSSV